MFIVHIFKSHIFNRIDRHSAGDVVTIMNLAFTTHNLFFVSMDRSWSLGRYYKSGLANESKTTGQARLSGQKDFLAGRPSGRQDLWVGKTFWSASGRQDLRAGNTFGSVRPSYGKLSGRQDLWTDKTFGAQDLQVDKAFGPARPSDWQDLRAGKTLGLTTP